MGDSTRAVPKRRRRTNGEGSGSEVRPGRWRWRRDTQEYGRVSGSGRTSQEARANVAARIADLNAAADAAAPSNLTVRDWLADWLMEKHGTVRNTTWAIYETLMRVHVLPHIGYIRLADLGRADITRLQATLAETPVASRTRAMHAKALVTPRRTLSSSTRHSIHAVLSTALQAAVEAEIVNTNAARKVKAPRIVRKERIILSPAHVVAVLKAAEGDPYEAAYTIGLTMGLREGEILGLRWDRIMFTSRQILVDASLGKTGTPRTTVLGDTKTAQSKRLVTMSQYAYDALQRLHATSESEWLFPDLTKDHFLKKQWRGVLTRAGLPRMPFHDTRHTAATIMLGVGGVNARVVQETLGHANVATTLRVYAHVTREMRVEGAPAMDRVLTAA